MIKRKDRVCQLGDGTTKYHKVCPECKISTEVTEITYPHTRHVRMRITPDRVDDKLQIDTYDADVKEEWCEYGLYDQEADYYCVNCDHHFYKAACWDDVWKQMVWRKK